MAFYQVDADEEKGLVARLDVQAVPSLLVFISGMEAGVLLGFHSIDELHMRLWSIISTGERF
jgi:thioredoxin-like negative regulator of GroEL